MRIASSRRMHVERVQLGVARAVKPLRGGVEPPADVALGTSFTQTAIFTFASLLNTCRIRPADYLPMNEACRFSTNAFMPSRASSVENMSE